MFPIGIPLASVQAGQILEDRFDSLTVSSEEVRDYLLALKISLVTNSESEAFRTELESLLRRDAFVSVVSQSQPGFKRYFRELLRSRIIDVEPSLVARNVTLAVKVICTI